MDLSINIKRTPQHVITEAGGYILTIDRSHPLVQLAETLDPPDRFFATYHRDVLNVIRALLDSGKAQDDVMAFMNGPDSFVELRQSEASEVSA